MHSPNSESENVRNACTNTVTSRTWGFRGGIPVQGDYDGDGKTDVAVYNPSNGDWWILNSATGNTTTVRCGIEEDLPVPGDYDGDRKTDVFSVSCP